MSLYGALFTGVSGLSAQASKIGVISDNISNVNTVGYKSAETQFETLVVNNNFNASQTSYSPGGVLANTRQEVDKQGLLLATDAPTDIAITGDGFFVVNGRPDASDVPQYTRAGSFRADSLGNFVNAAGYYLQGWPLDTAGNIPTTSANLDSLETVNVDSATGAASATTLMSIGANLDARQTIFPGEADQVTMDINSAVNYQISADDIILSSEFNLAPTNSITRLDQFQITTGNGLEFNYTYGGYTGSRDVTTGVNNFGDAEIDNQAVLALAGAALTSGAPAGSTFIDVTIPNHGLITNDTLTLAGFLGFDGIPAGEINSTHTITRIDANTVRFTTTTGSVAGGVNPAAGGTGDTRQFAGNILDATTVNETFLQGNSNLNSFTTAAQTLTITTQTVGTVTFRYTTSSPSTVSGEFNNLTNLAQAIDEVVGLTARVESGRLVVGSEDANEAVTFANGDAAGTATLRGIDWISELDIVDVQAGSQRFSTLQGLADLVNEDDGVTAVVNNALSDTTLEIRVDDPLDTIQFDDFVQNPPTRLPNNPFNVAAPGGPAPANVTVQVTDTNHGFSVGQNVTFTSATAFGGLTAAELNTSHRITNVIDANTYEIEIVPVGAVAVAAGGGNIVDRAQTNNGSLLAELGIVPSLNGAAYTPQSTGALGPRYDATGAVGDNMASGEIEPQFSRSLRVFDALGTPHDLQQSFIKVRENVWATEIFSVPVDDVNTTLVNGQVATGEIVFNGDGSLRSVSPGLSNPININWTNGSLPSTITLDFGTAGVPQGTANATAFGDTNGMSQFASDYNVKFVNQNGSQVGDLVGVNIGSDGVVSVSFSNGDVQNVYQLPIADFSNPNGLAAGSGNVYSQTRGSGEVNLRQAGANGTGSVVSAALEASNVELSEQLTDLIVAQRAYQSNTKTITTADELLEELNRL
jgi:flagellar hook-basal body protein